MAEIMLGNELHPDRVIPIEKLYEILNECGINYSFLAQHAIENNAFAVVQCKDCVYENIHTCPLCYIEKQSLSFVNHDSDFFCKYGERRIPDGEKICDNSARSLTQAPLPITARRVAPCGEESEGETGWQ